MKTDKEYPATHSMSTAWYVADEEGNVAIIDYNENGPVPWETEQESIEGLVFGHEEENDYIPINLTSDQINDLITNPRTPKIDEDVCFYSVLRIDKKQAVSFIKSLKKANIKYFNISKEQSLYIVDMYDLEEASLLPKMIGNNVILKVYDVKDYDIDDEWKNGKLTYTFNFKSSPYFIYAQPYNIDHLLERLNIPDNPVKLSQFPEPFRQRVPHVPIKFRERKNFQIAQWVPCNVTTGETRVVDGCRYDLLPMTDGREAYVLTSIDEIDFLPYCSEKTKYKCTECNLNSNCASAFAITFTHRPTVLKIVSPYREHDYSLNTNTDIITMHCIILPYLPKIPKTMMGRHFAETMKKEVSQLELDLYFKKCQKYLDDMLMRYKPRVVIIGDDVYKALRKVYVMSKRAIEIGGDTYPFFREKDIEANRKEIEQLAQMPYRGTVFPLVISKEEMERIGEDRDD